MRYVQENNIDFFTFDNMSTDDSYKTLVNCGYDVMKVNTASFNLEFMNQMYANKFHIDKPDWCIIAGVDSFYYCPPFNNLRHLIEHADDNGFDAIDTSRVLNFWYTGFEKDKPEDIRKEYFFYEEANNSWKSIQIFKYRPDFYIDGDKIQAENVYYNPDFAVLHYRVLKHGKDKKTEQLKRRELAWQTGQTRKCHGVHIKKTIENNIWQKDRTELSDIRNSIYWNLIK